MFGKSYATSKRPRYGLPGTPTFTAPGRPSRALLAISEGSAVESDEEIDLDEFYKEYIRPGPGSATVVAEADDPEAGARITYLLNAIERDQHGSEARRRS